MGHTKSINRHNFVYNPAFQNGFIIWLNIMSVYHIIKFYFNFCTTKHCIKDVTEVIQLNKNIYFIRFQEFNSVRMLKSGY